MNSMATDNGSSARHRAIREHLERDRFVLDFDRPATIERLRSDVARIASAMDDDGVAPPMLWTGLPLPRPIANPSADLSLVISVGGTRTGVGLMRLESGELEIIDANGRRVAGSDRVEAVKRRLEFATPTPADTASGEAMIETIAERTLAVLGESRSELSRASGLLLSWCFPHRVLRLSDRVLGGVTARTTEMKKSQKSFTDIVDRLVGRLFTTAFERLARWTPPRVTVSNDGAMALHYFLTEAYQTAYDQIGLFILGTGTNFALAEPYAVRRSGVVATADDDGYEPRRLRAGESPGARELPAPQHFVVNYEIGGIALAATQSDLDTAPAHSHPLEHNVLGGGHALEAQLRAVIAERIDGSLYSRLVSACGRAPAGPEISRIRSAPNARAIADAFPAAKLREDEARDVRLAAEVVAERAAAHAALVLAAVTVRRGFGRGGRGRPDLLAVEGSGWRIPGFGRLVTERWERLVGASLRVEIGHEPRWNASLPGPLYLAALHGSG